MMILLMAFAVAALLAKPFPFSELLARLEAVMCRVKNVTEHIIAAKLGIEF